MYELQIGQRCGKAGMRSSIFRASFEYRADENFPSRTPESHVPKPSIAPQAVRIFVLVNNLPSASRFAHFAQAPPYFLIDAQHVQVNNSPAKRVWKHCSHRSRCTEHCKLAWHPHCSRYPAATGSVHLTVVPTGLLSREAHTRGARDTNRQMHQDVVHS